MNYNSLSDKELLNYLDLYNDDPLVRRLLKILEEGSIVQELVDAGMDPTNRTFEHDWQHLSPGDYIEQLRRDMEYHIEERDEIEQEKEHLEREVTRLSTMSLVKFIADVHQTLEMNKSERDRAVRQSEHERKLRNEAEQKFEFWEKLNHGIK
jgi:hypothetical protein